MARRVIVEVQQYSPPAVERRHARPSAPPVVEHRRPAAVTSSGQPVFTADQPRSPSSPRPKRPPQAPEAPPALSTGKFQKAVHRASQQQLVDLAHRFAVALSKRVGDVAFEVVEQELAELGFHTTKKGEPPPQEGSRLRRTTLYLQRDTWSRLWASSKAQKRNESRIVDEILQEHLPPKP